MAKAPSLGADIEESDLKIVFMYVQTHNEDF